MRSWSSFQQKITVVVAATLVGAGLYAGVVETADVVRAADGGAKPAEVTETTIPTGGDAQREPFEPQAEPEPGPEAREELGGAAEEDHEGHGHVDLEDAEVAAQLTTTDVEPFSLLGVTWDRGATVTPYVEVRHRAQDGSWSEWTELHTDGGADDVEGGRPGTEPLWVGDADGVDVKVATPAGTTLQGVKVSTVTAGTATDIAPASVSQPNIITRSQWGASGGSSCSAPIYGSSTLGAVIHHTAGSNSYSRTQSAGIVRSTQAYHTGSRNWCDIGYNFLVDQYGQIFEGRKGGIDRQVRAAHSGNGPVNERTMGVSMMGTFASTEPATAMKQAVADLVAWRFSRSGLSATGTYSLGGKSLHRIAGHRNVVSTECPGARAYTWLVSTGSSGLRQMVASRLKSGTGASLASPTGLRSTSATSSSLSFDWDDVAGAERYHVKVSTSSSLSSPVYGKFDVSEGTVTGLKPGTKYFFSVVVVDPARNVRLSEYSPAPHPAASTLAFSAPTGLRSTSGTASSLSFDWDDVPGAQRYHVKVSTSSSLSKPVYGKFDESKGTVTGLQPGTRYFFSVVVVDPARNVRLSEYSAAPHPSATTKTNAGGMAYAPPTGLRSTSATSSALAFDWDDVPGAQKYHVKVSTSSAMTSPTFGKFTESKGTVTGLKPGTKYFFSVVVVDPTRNVRLSEYSPAPHPSATTRTIAGGMAYASPTGLRSTSATASSLTFDWDDVAGAKRYHVKVSTSSAMTSPTFGKFDTSEGTVTGLKPGTKYYFSVVVVDPARNVRLSEYSPAPHPSATTRTNPGGMDYAPPTGLRSTSATASSLTFDWDDVPGAKRYHVKVSTSSAMTSPTFGKFDESKGTVSGLKAGTKYFFSVVVVDPARNVRLSEYSPAPHPSATTRTIAGGMAYAPPTGLRSTSATASSLTFDWDDVAGAKRYHVKVSTSSSLTKPIYGKFDESKGTVSGLKAGTKYFFSVVVVDPARNVRLSEYSPAPHPSATTTAATSARNTLTVPDSRNVAIKGHGYGHGIGMSQYGAHGGAREGRTHAQILAKYYPGTALGTKKGSIRVLLTGATSNTMTVLGASGLGFRQPVTGSRIDLPTSFSGRAVERWTIEPHSSDKTKSVLRYRTSAGWKTHRTWTGEAQIERSGALQLVTPSGTKSYRTALRSVRPTTTTRDVVNVLSIEDYTRGVVAREMPSSWHAEALRAQSVAARTYGVRSITSSGRHDICDTTSCQVYGGVAAETASTDAAVKATAGKILTHNGAPAFTQFSSSSGGHTNVGSQPYLKAVSDPWDNWSGNANHAWSTTVKAATIEKAYPAIGTLRSLTVTKRNGHGSLGGRVSSITLKGSKASRTITGVDARWAFGLKSDWFGF